MKVSSILRQKGTHVETASQDTTLGEAAARLCNQGVGSLVILDRSGTLLGVLSERDVVRALTQYGARTATLPVARVLSGSPATCDPEDSVAFVMAEMTARRARHLPVVAEDVLVGIVSIGDVVKSQLDDLTLEVGVLRDHARMRR
ncbi:MAG: CBS domain-containing protein [Myxococcota bacterium]